MTEFNLQEFLKGYKPKKVDISPYLKCSKLRSYKIMNNTNDLVLCKTYIKYIKEEDLHRDDKLNEHIKTGDEEQISTKRPIKKFIKKTPKAESDDDDDSY